MTQSVFCTPKCKKIISLAQTFATDEQRIKLTPAASSECNKWPAAAAARTEVRAGQPFSRAAMLSFALQNGIPLQQQSRQTNSIVYGLWLVIK